MAKKATKPSTTARKQKTELTFMDGMADGYTWAVTSDDCDVLEFVQHVGWDIPFSKRYPWTECPFPDLRKTLESKGCRYTVGFIRAVQDSFQAKHSALVFHRHQEGVEDGRRWASEYANDIQHVRIREFAQSEGTREIFVRPYPHDSHGLWTPAHELVEHLFNDTYPYDEYLAPLFDCSEFREFWQPFVSEPMDKVMSDLKLYGFRAGHKLQDHHYIAGFVDGALGLSEQLGRRLSERTLPPKVCLNRGG